MIGVDSPTPLDLRFRLGPFPVRVTVWFWVVLALFGYGITRGPLGTNPWVNLLLWVAAAFVSILVHELGHAVAFRVFGTFATITLHGFGGYASPSDHVPKAWQRLVVNLAGPAAGFALFGLVHAFWLFVVRPEWHPYLLNFLAYLWYMNLVWNLFNLLPIRPLDGGNVLRELLALGRARNPDAISHGVSFGLSALIAVYAALSSIDSVPPAVEQWLPPWLAAFFKFGMFGILWFALLAVDNYQRMQLARRRFYHYEPPDEEYDDTPPWRRR